jgi:hypothetical protein
VNNLGRFPYNEINRLSSQGQIGVLIVADLQGAVLGNPVERSKLTLEVWGAQGQPLAVQVLYEQDH